MVLERPCLLLGLINPSYGFRGLDGAVNLAEDCFEPASTLLWPCTRSHDSFLPGHLDAVLREGHLRNNKQFEAGESCHEYQYTIEN